MGALSSAGKAAKVDKERGDNDVTVGMEQDKHSDSLSSHKGTNTHRSACVRYVSARVHTSSPAHTMVLAPAAELHPRGVERVEPTMSRAGEEEGKKD